MADNDRVAARRQRVAEMREAGMSQVEISKRLGLHPSTVEIDCLEMGVFAPGRMRKTPAIRPCMRNGRMVRPFTAEEDARLVEMSLAGKSYKTMGRALGRTHGTCRTRLLTLARHDEAAA